MRTTAKRCEQLTHVRIDTNPSSSPAVVPRAYAPPKRRGMYDRQTAHTPGARYPKVSSAPAVCPSLTHVTHPLRSGSPGPVAGRRDPMSGRVWVCRSRLRLPSQRPSPFPTHTLQEPLSYRRWFDMQFPCRAGFHGGNPPQWNALVSGGFVGAWWVQVGF